MNTTKPIQTFSQRRAARTKLDVAKQWKEYGHHRQKARRARRPPLDLT